MHLVIENVKSDMFKHMEVIGMDSIQFFRKNKYQVKVSNAGIVTYTFVENFPASHHTEKNPPNQTTNTGVLLCRLNV